MKLLIGFVVVGIAFLFFFGAIDIQADYQQNTVMAVNSNSSWAKDFEDENVVIYTPFGKYCSAIFSKVNGFVNIACR